MTFRIFSGVSVREQINGIQVSDRRTFCKSCSRSGEFAKAILSIMLSPKSVCLLTCPACSIFPFCISRASILVVPRSNSSASVWSAGISGINCWRCSGSDADVIFLFFKPKLLGSHSSQRASSRARLPLISPFPIW